MNVRVCDFLREKASPCTRLHVLKPACINTSVFVRVYMDVKDDIGCIIIIEQTKPPLNDLNDFYPVAVSPCESYLKL